MAQAQPVRREGRVPPEPWRLTGEAWLLAWRVREGEIATPWPAGFRPLRLGRRLLVGAVWAIYRPGGDLAYEELAVGVVGREGLRPAVTIPWIWVDDQAALEGGRALWAIPKQIAAFDERGGRREARDGQGPLASLRFRGGPPLPARWRAAFHVVQPGEAGPVSTPVRVGARLSLGRAEWAAAGRLAHLAGRRPFLALRLDRARLTFGRETAGVR
jgi:hypothetical protein